MALSVYLGSSVLVAAFTHDALSARADALFAARTEKLIVSDLASVEFVSVIARKTRTGEIEPAAAKVGFQHFDTWRGAVSERIAIGPPDLEWAAMVIRRLDLPLRAPDAIRLAITRRLAATLATFDQQMAACARALGIGVAAA